MFGKQDWIAAVRQWPTSTIVGTVLGGIATWFARTVGIPAIDQLEWPVLTGLGYLVIFFVSSFLFVLLIAAVRWTEHPQDFVADAHPKEVLRYLCKDAKWAQQFGSNRTAWFKSTSMALRDELRQGRRLRAQGRPS
jgi:hypothetical protein